MTIRFLAIAAVATISAHAANATVYINTVTGSNPTFGYDGLYDNTPAMAVSFTAPAANFSVVSLLLGAGTPSDGGSALVYLVPDNGSGSAGVAGAPVTAFNGAGVFTGFPGAELIGTVDDSSLSAAPGAGTLVSFGVNPTITSPDDEYWIGLVPQAGSSVDWYFSSLDNGVGTTGQVSYFANTPANEPPQGVITSDANVTVGGPYGLIVSTPEPATLAILSGGVAGLAWFRRRAVRKD